MTTMPNRYEQLLAHLHRRPFVPFVVVRDDGKRFEVSERVRMALSESTVAIVSASGQGSTDVFRTHRVTDVLTLTPAN